MRDSEPAVSAGALDGVVCLDLTVNAPGPFCTMILGDLGADVIRVYDPRPLSGRREESAEGAAAPPAIAGGDAPENALLRNKRAIGIDLKGEAGRALLERLVKRADVLVEGMRPRAAARLGVDYATLRVLNPRLVHCSLTGYGQTGPYADLPGHDVNYIGQAGALSLIATPDGRPVVPQNLLADFAGGGLLATIGILAALFARERTGVGQHVDAAMTDGVVYVLAQFLSAYFATGEIPAAGRSAFSGGLGQYGVYEAADGRWLTLGALEPWFFAKLCRAFGWEDLIPHGFDARNAELRERLADELATRTRDEWFERLSKDDQCVGRVLSLDELERDPQVRAREMVLTLRTDAGRAVRQVGIAPKLSETPGSVRRIADARGSNAVEILSAVGLDADEIQALRARGTVE